jgi:hypothetical protein
MVFQRFSSTIPKKKHEFSKKNNENKKKLQFSHKIKENPKIHKF